jgi:hypothetical protein
VPTILTSHAMPPRKPPLNIPVMIRRMPPDGRVNGEPEKLSVGSTSEVSIRVVRVPASMDGPDAKESGQRAPASNPDQAGDGVNKSESGISNSPSGESKLPVPALCPTVTVYGAQDQCGEE